MVSAFQIQPCDRARPDAARQPKQPFKKTKIDASRSVTPADEAGIVFSPWHRFGLTNLR